jgi:hypothetical protein
MAATAKRRLFVNWFTKKLQLSDRKSGEFTLPAFTKYETIPLEICIIEPDLAGVGIDRYSRVDISNLSLTVTINETYDDPAPLAQQATWTKNEDDNVFSAELALNTAALNAYLGSSDSKTAYIEIEIQEGTARNKIFIAAITLQNAVSQITSVAPTPLDEYYTKPQVTAQFVAKVMPAGEQITITSPGGIYQRIVGVDDGGAPIDIILPV